MEPNRMRLILDAEEERLSKLFKRKVQIKLLPHDGEREVEKLEVLLSAICEQFGLQRKDISGKKRRTDIVIGRHLYCYFARKYFQITFTDIGRSVNRDHTSVIHACEKVEELLSVKDKYITDAYNAILHEVIMIALQ